VDTERGLGRAIFAGVLLAVGGVPNSIWGIAALLPQVAATVAAIILVLGVALALHDNRGRAGGQLDPRRGGRDPGSALRGGVKIVVREAGRPRRERMATLKR
jgi:hypothetical protein